MELYDTITTILEDPDFKIKVEFLKGMFLCQRPRFCTYRICAKASFECPVLTHPAWFWV